MDDDYKKRIKEAIHKFQAKIDRPKQSRGHYGKPEKEVEKVCMALMRSWGWSVDVFEAKATYNPKAGTWLQQSMKAGTCDCMGNTADGIAVAVEFKAPGKLNTLREKQRLFLEAKISSGAFSCVVDSALRLTELYEKWTVFRLKDLEHSKKFLMLQLPKRKEDGDDGKLFG